MSDETTPLTRDQPGLNSYSSAGDSVQESQLYKQRWRSVRIMYLTMFLSSVAFSICMSSIYPFLQRLEPSSTASTVGWVIASYSLGQFVASPFFGWWANRRHSTREPLVASTIIFVISNLLYAYLQDFNSARVALLITARTLVGFGAGNVAVARSYVAGATTLGERTSAMATIAGAQALGFVLGPAFQSAFAPLGYPGPVQEVWLQLNVYTAPALMSALVSVVNIVLIIRVFREIRISPYEPINEPNGGSEQQPVSSEDATAVISDKDDKLMPEIKPDLPAAIACIFIFFIVLFMFSIFETIATPIAQDMFSWTNEQSTFYVGIIMLGAGLVSAIDFLMIKHISKRFDERRILIASLTICVLGYIGHLPWGAEKPDIKPDVISYMNGTWTQVSNGTTVEPVGCPSDYAWCYTTPKIYLWQLILCVIIIAVGYPMSNVFTYSIYSKALGPKPQGTMMGWLTAAGSMARMLGPIFVTNVYEVYGPRLTFALVSGIVSSSIVAVVALYSRLVPYHLHVAKVKQAAILQRSPQPCG